MATLEITETKAEQLNKLEDVSIQILQEYLEGKRAGGDEIVTARCVLNVIKGNRQTDTARQALRYNMVQDLANPDILKKYVTSTQPNIGKLLKGDTK